MIKEMSILGVHLYNFLNSLKENVVIINSCDLAHTHKIIGGPDEGKEPYGKIHNFIYLGVTKESEVFDNLIERWILKPNEK